ncbi:MAG: hypothetical protein U9O95_02565 [Candidatus Marinimicrobia bacterium]|nr:hypothetical protein [Candidatus Neomarinimicrobiota bacterium]
MFRTQSTDNLDKLKELFTYRNISGTDELNDDDFTFYSRIEQKKAFIKFAYIGDDSLYLPKLSHGQKSLPPGGWKLHIAIDDKNPENIVKAWDIIKDILIDQRIAEAKVIKPGVSFASDVTQCGKQITIYQFFNPERDWNAIIHEIELRLMRAEIHAGQFSPTDKPVTGSMYITYRNDLSEDSGHIIDSGKTMGFPEDKRYNPFERPDPFVDIKIQLQPEETTDSGLKP